MSDLIDLSALDELAGAVTAAIAVVPVGARTQWEVGGPPPTGTTVTAPAGVVRYEPADMTVTVGAGTSYRELDAVLAEHGQECALDPVDANATIGGILATGLSGRRRLRHGPVRDHLLEVRVVDADGRVVKGGGPTVKNVTGYDLPRLFVGSFGTLGVLGHVTLRCRPRPATARWFRVADGAHPGFRPSAVLSDGTTTSVLLEGAAADVTVQAAGMQECDPPGHIDGEHRGRISVAPGRVDAVGAALARERGVRWLAELGVGTVHVACDESAGLAAARAVAHAHDGWLLREAGGGDIDGYGRPLPNLALMRRIKSAFDPTGKLAPGRLPL
ncbi:MAG: FAD-binding protein [Actinomycetota bacterium]|nr:FAD-binding protein [Actinomycetota bacterium]